MGKFHGSSSYLIYDKYEIVETYYKKIGMR